jgi:hypothetical protein
MEFRVRTKALWAKVMLDAMLTVRGEIWGLVSFEALD